MGKSDELVLLRRCANPAEAYRVQAFLEAADIPCHIQGQHTVQFMGPVATEFDLGVLVAPSDLEKAEKVIAEADEGLEPLADDAEVPGPEELAASGTDEG